MDNAPTPSAAFRTSLLKLVRALSKSMSTVIPELAADASALKEATPPLLNADKASATEIPLSIAMKVDSRPLKPPA